MLEITIVSATSVAVKRPEIRRITSSKNSQMRNIRPSQNVRTGTAAVVPTLGRRITISRAQTGGVHEAHLGEDQED